MATTTKLLTAEEFWLLPSTELRRELVRGEVAEAMPTGGKHSAIVITFGALLHRWADVNDAGVVGTGAGFILDRDPDLVRALDLYFVRAERLPDGEPPDAFYELAPDFAVEVVSPSETAEGVEEKVRDYLAAGTALVALVYPRTRRLIAHAADGSARTYREDETFSAPQVLPGFSCRVAELFSRAARRG